MANDPTSNKADDDQATQEWVDPTAEVYEREAKLAEQAAKQAKKDAKGDS